MSVKPSDLWSQMIAAASASLGDDWPKVKRYAESELKRLARTLVDIGKLAASGEISTAEAKALIKIHRNTTLTVLLAAKGMSIIAVEKAVNNALGVVKEAVTGAFGPIL